MVLCSYFCCCSCIIITIGCPQKACHISTNTLFIVPKYFDDTCCAFVLSKRAGRPNDWPTDRARGNGNTHPSYVLFVFLLFFVESLLITCYLSNYCPVNIPIRSARNSHADTPTAHTHTQTQTWTGEWVRDRIRAANNVGHANQPKWTFVIFSLLFPRVHCASISFLYSSVYFLYNNNNSITSSG